MINQADERRKQTMMARMQQATQAPQPQQPQPTYVPPVADPYASLAQQAPAPQPAQPQYNDPNVEFNPYPNAIHQSVIQPLEQESQLSPSQVIPDAPPSPPATQPQPAAEVPPATSEKAIPPDIINLASNTDLSIETIQREANRIQHKADEDSGEVFISLH
jgi:hypothetical protein